MSGETLEPIDPQRAAEDVLAAAPDDATAEPGADQGDEAGGDPAPEVDANALRAQLFALVDTGDVLLRLLFGPGMAATREEKHEIAEAWLPYASTIEGGLKLPLWVPGVFATASLYGPKFRARKAAAGAPKQPPRDAEAERTS